MFKLNHISTYFCFLLVNTNTSINLSNKQQGSHKSNRPCYQNIRKCQQHTIAPEHKGASSSLNRQDTSIVVDTVQEDVRTAS